MTGDSAAPLLDALYRGATDVAEFERALVLLAERYACRSSALVSINSHMPAADMVLSVGVFDAAARRRYAEQFAALDPAPAAFARMPIGTASTTMRILTKEQNESLPFVQEFYRPLGLAETIGGNLQSDNGRFELIGLHRGPDRPPFEDTELAEVERLMPHIVRALQLRRAFLRLEAKASGLETAIDRLAAGVVLLDPDGAALFVNRAMSAIACRRDGLALDRRGRPVPAGRDARQRLNALIDAVAHGGAGGIMTVPCTTGPRPYALLVAPLPSSYAPALGSWRGSQGAIVIVHDPAGNALSNPDILAQGLGLPRGAARLVAALAAEDDLKRFAEREGVTIHAARFHLRTALGRTGARTQAELVRIAVRLLRDFGLRQSEGGRF